MIIKNNDNLIKNQQERFWKTAYFLAVFNIVFNIL